MASLLVSLGEETNCNCASVSFSDWSAGGAHPRSWGIDSVDWATMHYLRCVSRKVAVLQLPPCCRTSGGTQPWCGNTSRVATSTVRQLLGTRPWREVLQVYDGRWLEGCAMFARKVVEEYLPA